MPLIDATLYVEAAQVGVSWQFTAKIFVEDPAGSMNWRRAKAGEVEVELKYLGEWWQFPTTMEKLMSDAAGNVVFAGSWGSGSYTMEAIHQVSQDHYKVRLDCHDDGTFDSDIEIE
ncbi:hypothetical protein ES705_15955 [subsurface metagenome]